MNRFYSDEHHALDMRLITIGARLDEIEATLMNLNDRFMDLEHENRKLRKALEAFAPGSPRDVPEVSLVQV